jgi:membrane protein
VRRLQLWLVTLLRVLDAVGSAFLRGDLSLRATSLVYTTLLSLVPCLALGFSLLKAFDIHNQMEPVLLESLKALGPTKAQEVAQSLMRFVENMKVGVLGAVGVSLLLYSALSLIQQVESAFNDIWNVERPRAFAQRLGEYLAVLTVGPLVVFSALGATASLFNNGLVHWLSQMPLFGFVFEVATATVPYLMIVGLFVFLYRFVPNTQVRLVPACIGGAIAGLLWQTASLAFASFVSTATNYNAIYSSFAILVFVLIWLQLGWLILLSGCQLAYFAQHPERMNPYAQPPIAAGRAREQLGLALMRMVTLRYYAGSALVTKSRMAEILGVTATSLSELAAPLIAAGLLAETEITYLPATDPERIPMAQVWKALRGESVARSQADLNAAETWLQSAEAAATAAAQSLKSWCGAECLVAPAFSP